MCKAVLISLAAAVACTQSWPDTPACRAGEFTIRGNATNVDQVDVLFVIDDGPSMVEEQALLAREIPRVADFLMHGDEAERIRRPIESLRVGVTGCDGVLRSSAGCGTGGDPYVWNFPGFHDAAQSRDKIVCNAAVGVNGCGRAQLLQAALDAAATPGFRRHDPLRAAAPLLFVIITDKDDASAGTVEEYIAKFEALAGSVLGILIVAGLPPELDVAAFDQSTREAEAEHEAYYDRVLDDPRLRPGAVSCASPQAIALAPPRLIDFARRFGSHAVVQSTCREDFRRGLHRLTWYPWHFFPFGRVPEHVTPAAGSDCKLTWELPANHDPELPLTPVKCSDRPKFLQPVNEASDRTVCMVNDVEPPSDAGTTEEGFYFTPVNPSRPEIGSQLAYTPAAAVPHGIKVRLTCTRSVCEDE